MTEEKIRDIFYKVVKEQQLTSIMSPGVVYDNNDPKMLNRLRVIPENQDYKAIINQIQGWVEERDAWTSKDPILFLPLLPFFFNQTPLNKEYVHLIYYDKMYPEHNKFYIQGPFSDPRNIVRENYESSKQQLGAGIRVKPTNDIKDKDKEYKSALSKGIFPEPEDNAVLSRGSSDIILKNDEALIRAGKTEGLDVNRLPVGNYRRSFLQLSNFKTTKVEGTEENVIENIEVVKSVKMMVIWNIANLENAQNVFNGYVRLFEVTNKNNNITSTKSFSPETITKLNEGQDYKKLTGVDFELSSKDEAVNLINNFILEVFNGEVKNPSPGEQPYKISDDNQFPFVITPSKQTYLTGNKFSGGSINTQIKEIQNYIDFYSSIKIDGNKFTRGYFLVSSNLNNKPVTGPLTEIKEYTIKPSKFEQSPKTYGILGAQKLYLLSHDSVGPKGSVNLTDTLYGIPQNKFVGPNGIDEVTYSSVRGEELLSLLRIMFVFLRDHVHSISTKPPVPLSAGSQISTTYIDGLLAEAENTILNQNIRIN